MQWWLSCPQMVRQGGAKMWIPDRFQGSQIVQFVHWRAQPQFRRHWKIGRELIHHFGIDRAPKHASSIEQNRCSKDSSQESPQSGGRQRSLPASSDGPYWSKFMTSLQAGRCLCDRYHCFSEIIQPPVLAQLASDCFMQLA